MLTQKALAELNVEDNTLSRIQSNISTVLNPVLATPILDGVLVTGLVIPSTLKLSIPHKLGRTPNGALIVRASAAISTYCMLAADQTAPTGSIVLTFTSGAGAVLNAWVF